MKILITGGTGFIGKTLVNELAKKNHEIVILSRHADGGKKDSQKNLRTVLWDGETSGDWTGEVAQSDAVIHLAGEPIAEKRWTQKQKQKIAESRIIGTRTIVDAIFKAKQKPSVFISGSAVGFYGDVPEGDVTEKTPSGKGFLAETCRAWEREAVRAEQAGVRVILFRTGVVLEKGGGALAKLLPPFQLFAGGPIGSGKQWFPWIHRDDVVGLILFLLEHRDFSGAINATAPQPVRMNEFCKTLGRAMHRPSWAPVPGFVLKILIGEMAEEMLLSGQKVLPEQAKKINYPFRYPDLEKALKAILGK